MVASNIPYKQPLRGPARDQTCADKFYKKAVDTSELWPYIGCPFTGVAEKKLPGFGIKKFLLDILNTRWQIRHRHSIRRLLETQDSPGGERKWESLAQ